MSTDQSHFWMPFTAQRQFAQRPRMLESAKGMHYRSDDGREILDGTAGLWCVNAGHGREQITQAVAAQLEKCDFAPSFQMGHSIAFELAEKLCAITPAGLDRVFFTNSGSEAVDTALKIALAYHHANGQAQRTRLIGRQKGYHGVGFGGISVGGLMNNRRAFGAQLPYVDHLPHTLDLKRNAFSRGLPTHGIELADELEQICLLHGGDTIAAVIIEPLSGSAGVILPPEGYLKRIREICDIHGILLIFDEVITGFGRVGSAFAAQRFGVTPDLITAAKGLTNGAIPMGAVFAKNSIHQTLQKGPEGVIELFHGYTYSAHPAACAAALAALDIYQNENLFDRALQLEAAFADAAHSLADLPNVIDVRNCGLVVGIELASRKGAVGARAYDVFTDCFHERNTLIRVTGDTIALSPPLTISPQQIQQLFATVGEAIAKAA